MSEPDFSVMPILATPFGVAEIPESGSLNPAVTALFDARTPRPGTPARRDPLVYRSQDDLLEWTDEPVRQLATALFRGLYAVVGAVNELTPDAWRSLSVQARAWYTIVEPNGGVAAAQYPLTAWCGLYWLAAPPPSATRQDSGLLRLYESRPGTMFADATTAQLKLPFTQGHHAWRPQPGHLAVFPASLAHEIAPLRNSERMVLITLRVRFVGPGQEGISRW